MVTRNIYHRNNSSYSYTSDFSIPFYGCDTMNYSPHNTGIFTRLDLLEKEPKKLNKTNDSQEFI